jgi:hypothetical protein
MVRVQGKEYVQGFKAQGTGYRVQDTGYMIQDIAYRV